jgi:hypothetical protein
MCHTTQGAKCCNLIRKSHSEVTLKCELRPLYATILRGCAVLFLYDSLNIDQVSTHALCVRTSPRWCDNSSPTGACRRDGPDSRVFDSHRECDLGHRYGGAIVLVLQVARCVSRHVNGLRRRDLDGEHNLPGGVVAWRRRATERSGERFDGCNVSSPARNDQGAHANPFRTSWQHILVRERRPPYSSSRGQIPARSRRIARSASRR